MKVHEVIDKTRLREAIDNENCQWSEDRQFVTLPREYHNELWNAAALVASEDTLTIQWCEEHHAEGIDYCWRAAYVMRRTTFAKAECRMVQRILL